METSIRTPRPSAHPGINTLNQIKRFVPAPRTCLIPELWELVEKHAVLLVDSRGRVPGWFFTPDNALIGIPAMLFLPPKSTRASQREAFFAVQGYYHCQKIMEQRQNEAAEVEA